MAEYQPLTQQEIQAIIDRHHFIVDSLNQTLGGVLKYEDDRIMQQVNDPKQVAIYRASEENKRRAEERAAIMRNLETKFGRGNLNQNPMARTIEFMMKTGNDPKDIAYNEKLYQEYITHPENIVYREAKKVLSLNPKQLYDIAADKEKCAEFYMENTSLCENAYAIQSMLETGGAQTTKALYEAVRTIKKPIETLNEFGNLVKQGGIDAIACPSLTSQQAELAVASPLFMNRQNHDLNEVVVSKLGHLEDPHDFFQKFIDYGIEIDDPDFLIKYKAVRTDPETGARRETSFDALFVDDDPNVRIEKRTKDEMFEIRSINRAFQDKYAAKFQSRIATRLNQRIFDAGQLEEDRKGNWFERKLLKSTSPEWTQFIEAFKNYNDPNHADYLRKDVLRPKAQAYMDHKRDQGYGSLEDMKGTSLKRGTLCQSVIDVCDELDREEEQIREDIEIEINTGFKGKVGLFISAEEVDIFDDGNQIKSDNEIHKEAKIENEIEKAPVINNDIGIKN